MNLIAAKCPNCGANIEVSPEMEATKCKSCGSAILVEDAIQKYKIEVSGQVSLSGISSVENDLKLGEQCLDAKDWKSAYNVFSGAIDKNADSFAALYGCLTAMTNGFTAIDQEWVKLNGIKGIKSVIKNCIVHEPDRRSAETYNKIHNFLDSKIKKENDSYSQYLRRVNDDTPKYNVLTILEAIILLISIVIFYYS